MDLLNSLKPILERITTLALNDAECRVHLRELAFKILAQTSGPVGAGTTAAATSQPEAAPTRPVDNGDRLVQKLPPGKSDIIPPVRPPGTATPAVRAEGLGAETPLATKSAAAEAVEREVRLPTAWHETPAPRQDTGPSMPSWRWFEVKVDDLPVIEQRCLLKADAARWAGDRQRRLKEQGVAFIEDDGYPFLIDRAKELPDCYLWMCGPGAPQGVDAPRYEELTGCYQAAAAAVRTVYQVLQHQPESIDLFRTAAELLAEAQSALKVAVAAVEPKPDSDQNRIFYFLRATAEERHFLIPRFMRVDDPANPRLWRDIIERARPLEEKAKDAQEKKRRTKKRIDKLRYHLGRVSDRRGSDATHDWERVVATIDELVGDGMPPSAIEIRDALLPLVDDIPEGIEAPKSFQLVLREIDRYLSSRPAGAEEEEERTAERTAQVREVAGLLRGRSVVLIGGERRPYAEDALKEAFQLREVHWLDNREHQSHYPFEPYVARPEVALVLLAIRWSSHGFGEVKDFCDKYGKPVVRLPRGYNPNQVAREILTQVGERLSRRPAESVRYAGASE